METNPESSEKCHRRCHGNNGASQDKHRTIVYTTEYVFKAFSELFEEKKRPLCLADFKEYFRIREKRDAKHGSKWRDADKIEHVLRRLFKKGIFKIRRYG